MTGFAQVRGEVARQGSAAAAGKGSSNGHLAFSLSLKSVNHRFLDLHFRLPSGTDSLEMQLRRLLKEKMARGHVEVTLTLERAVSEAFSLNREIVGGSRRRSSLANASFRNANRIARPNGTRRVIRGKPRASVIALSMSSWVISPSLHR